MNTRDLIVICLTVFLLLCVGVFSIYYNFNETTDLDMTSNETLKEGDSLTLRLSDEKGFPIADENIEINLTDDDGITENFTMKTNSNGVCRLEDMIAGNFSFISKYYGNDNYNESTISEDITVNK